VQAGNIRTSLLTLKLVLQKDCYDRLLIGTDTPTATGVMPQGMIKTIAEMSCLSDVRPEVLIAAATGNNAKVYRLNSGFLQPGKDADIVLLEAALAGSKKTALESLKNGDVTSAVGCFTAGVPRYIGRSRCTPPPARNPKILKNEILSEFAAPPMVM